MPQVNQTPTASMTLLDLADLSYSEHSNTAESEADERFEQERETFLITARATARNRFGTAADQLEWAYTAHADLPEDTEEATAPIAPGRSEFLRYRYDHRGEVLTFELVQPCSTCGQQRVNEVTGLVELGRLMAETGGQR